MQRFLLGKGWGEDLLSCDNCVKFANRLQREHALELGCRDDDLLCQGLLERVTRIVKVDKQI
jgi:hypothetical protein